MSNTFLPLLKTNLKIAFDFRGKKQKASMLSLLLVITVFGMLASAVYSFIFIIVCLKILENYQKLKMVILL